MSHREIAVGGGVPTVEVSVEEHAAVMNAGTADQVERRRVGGVDHDRGGNNQITKFSKLTKFFRNDPEGDGK